MTFRITTVAIHRNGLNARLIYNPVFEEEEEEEGVGGMRRFVKLPSFRGQVVVFIALDITTLHE